MKDTKHIVYLDETKMDGEHRKYLLKAILIAVPIAASCYLTLIGLAVALKLIFE